MDTIIRRKFKELREQILLALSRGQKTTNQIANETGINWKTVENHLTYLKGKDLVIEIFNSSYVRIFELSESGKERLLKLFPNKFNNKEQIDMKIENNKIIES